MGNADTVSLWRAIAFFGGLDGKESYDATLHAPNEARRMQKVYEAKVAEMLANPLGKR